MQLLGFAPGAIVAVFTQVFDHQAHVLEVANACFRMSKPETFWMRPHQSGSALDQFRRRWNRSGSVVQFEFDGFASHDDTLRSDERKGKTGLEERIGNETVPFSCDRLSIRKVVTS